MLRLCGGDGGRGAEMTSGLCGLLQNNKTLNISALRVHTKVVCKRAISSVYTSVSSLDYMNIRSKQWPPFIYIKCMMSNEAYVLPSQSLKHSVLCYTIWNVWLVFCIQLSSTLSLRAPNNYSFVVQILYTSHQRWLRHILTVVSKLIQYIPVTAEGWECRWVE